MDHKDILKEHYVRLLKKVGSWIGLVAIAASSFVAVPAHALQITERSLTLGSSAASANTTYLFGFKPGTTGNVGAVKFQICTSPLELTACTTPTGGSQAGAASLTLGGQISGFSFGSGTPPAPAAQTVWITNGTPQSLTAGTASTVQYSGVVNPSTTNQTFYARITTYSDSAGTTQVDYGAVAVSTSTSIAVSANVQESLTFCVGTSGANCAGITGSTVSVGSGSDNVLSTSVPSGGTSIMYASTNATTGYAITYLAQNLRIGVSADAITAAGGTAATFSAGTAMFGINLVDNATPNFGANVSGTGTGTPTTQYNIADSFAFVPNTTTSAASVSGPTLENGFTVTYAAQAGNTSKPGAYTTTFNWIATGTF